MVFKKTYKCESPTCHNKTKKGEVRYCTPCFNTLEYRYSSIFGSWLEGTGRR